MYFGNILFSTSSDYKKNIITYFFILLILNLNACTYFVAKRSDVQGLQKTLDKARIGKKFILHNADKKYEIKAFELTEESISGNLEELDSANYYYNIYRSRRYKKPEASIIHEVHIYLNKDSSKALINGNQSIPLSAIQEIKIINPDTGKSIMVFIGVLVGSSLLIFIILAIIVALTKSSCPYIYTHDGEGFVFEGEIYGGALGQNIERDDYLPLPSIKPINDQYKIRLSNELKEKQHTDLANLLVVNHPSDCKVLIDQKGELHAIGNNQIQFKVATNSKNNIESVLLEKDSINYSFDDAEHDINAIHLEFDKEEEIQNYNLVLNAKNTLWFDYQVGEFFEKYGMAFDNWMAKQSELSTKERIQKTTERYIPLSVYIKNGENWQLVEHINTVGPMAFRDIVVPIKLDNYANKKIELKIETGFMFWEVDQLGIYPKQKKGLHTFRLTPKPDYKYGNGEVAASLAKTDKNYLHQLNTGDVAELAYNAPKVGKDSIQSVFLHARGYYELVREFDDWPQFSELYEYNDPLWMAERSRIQYLKTITHQESEKVQ